MAQVRILPLGNSITYGHYRYDLWKSLVEQNIEFSFVGSVQSNPASGGEVTVFPDVNGRPFDNHHEGHPGWTTRNILDGVGYDPNAGNLSGWLYTYDADIVLLHIGTNDVTFASAETTIENIKKIIRQLQADNPRVVVLLAKIIPRGGYEQQVININNRIDEVAAAMETATSCVKIVDHYSGYGVYTDNYDGIHPNRNGDIKMAKRWEEAILEVLESGNCVTIVDCTELSVRLQADEITCSGAASGALRPIIDNGSQPFTYQWSNGRTSYDITNLTSGTYTVTVTDANGCTQFASYSLVAPNPLVVDVNIVDVSRIDGTDGSANVVVDGGKSPYHYQWSTGESTPTINDLNKGNYGLTITDQNGCVQVTMFTINEPTCGELSLELSVQNPSCHSESSGIVSVLNPVEGNEYSWNNGQTTTSINDLSSGVYSVTMTDTIGCTTSQSIEVTDPPKIEMAFTLTNTTCGQNNGIASVMPSGGTGALDINWNNGSEEATITNLEPSSYEVQITDENNCVNWGQVSILGSNPLTISGAVTASKCFEEPTGTIVLDLANATFPVRYAWSDGSMEKELTNLGVGDYSVTVTDINNCMDTATFITTIPPELRLNIDAEQPTNPNNGVAKVNIEGGIKPYNIFWSTGAMDSVITDLAAGIYSVTVNDFNGCEKTSRVTLIEPTISATEVPIEEWKNLFYPTPARDILYLRTPIATGVISIFNSTGQLIEVLKIQGTTQNIVLQDWHKNKGLYWLRLQQEGEEYWQKLLIQ